MFDINEILYYLMHTDFMDTQAFLTYEDESGEEHYLDDDSGYCFVVAARGSKAKALHEAVQNLITQWKEQGTYTPGEYAQFINESSEVAEAGVPN